MSSAATTLPRRRFPIGKVAATLVIIAITVVFCLPGVGIGVDFSDFLNMGNLSGSLGQLVHPDWPYWRKPLGPLLETVEIAIIATAAGAIVSLPLSFLASRVTMPHRWFVSVFRGLLSILRSIPDLLFAAIFVAMVGVGALPGVLALFLFTIGIVVKLSSEVVDAIDTGPLEAALSTGATWAQTDRVAALPQMLPAFAGILLYVLELNIRASAVLGLVGAGGLGDLINLNRGYFHYDRIAIIVLEILIMVIILEFISTALRKRLS